VRGAFLIAPNDVEQPSYPIDPGASGYGPWPEGMALLRDAPEFAGV